jgi:5-methylcytosine-specific restriction endonuclease McrA
MKGDYRDLAGVDETEIRREKAKAREIRKSRWWQNKLAAGSCYYCGGRFRPAELTMDHLVPVARGGQSTRGNLVTCCKECNNRKRSMLPLEWEEYMERLTAEKS